MNPTNAIPQFALRNSHGKPVDFDVQVWGDVGHYDFLKAHRHHFHEILVFEKGGAQHDIDFTTHSAKTGSVHFVASDNVHLLIRQEKSKGFSLLFSTDYMAPGLILQLPFGTPNPVLMLNKDAFKALTVITTQIKAEHANPQPFSEQMLRSLTETFLLQLIRAYKAGNAEEPASSSSIHLQRFKQLIKDHHLQHLSVEMYAGKLGISAKHLIGICKKQTGKTPLKHIQEHTVSEAKRLLFHTKLTIKEIAYTLNFNDPAQFSKYFKLHTGYTPAAYREGKR